MNTPTVLDPVVFVDPQRFASWKQITVVGLDQIQHHVDDGWTILAFVTEDHVEQKSEQVQEKDPNGYSHYVTKTQYFPGKHTRVVMGRNDVSELSNLRDEARVHGNVRDALEKKIAAHEKAKLETERQFANMNATIDMMSKDLLDARTTKQKLEKDLAKVRTAIGDLKFKEIVA